MPRSCSSTSRCPSSCSRQRTRSCRRWRGGCSRESHRRWIRNAGSEAGMWSATIAMRDPFTKDAAKMSVIARDHPIQALSTDGADQTFAMRVRSRCSHGGLQNRKAHGRHGCIDALGAVVKPLHRNLKVRDRRSRGTRTARQFRQNVGQAVFLRITTTDPPYISDDGRLGSTTMRQSCLSKGPVR
jgi:hypothetical protein